jgi:hypothetical protein
MCSPWVYFKFWGAGGGGGERGNFFSFFLCSNMFPMCSPWVFPIAPCFNPICFAQSPPLLTYIGAPKGEALHLSIESLIFVSFHSFNFFLPRPINKKKLDLWGVKVKPKTVINFFGRRNFMQPMGRPKHTLNAPCIFSF